MSFTSIFDTVSAQTEKEASAVSPEETTVVPPEEGKSEDKKDDKDAAVVDEAEADAENEMDEKASPEEAQEEPEGLTEDEHEENVEEIRYVEEDLDDVVSAEETLGALLRYSDALKNISAEGVTPASADLVNGLADSIQNNITSRGGDILPFLQESKFTQEDFSPEASKDDVQRKGYIAAEGIGEKIKNAANIALEKLISLGKRILELISRLFANEQKLTDRCNAALAQVNKAGWGSPEGKKKVGHALCVDGKVDPIGAVRSYRENAKTIGQYTNNRNEVGFEELSKLMRNFEEARAKGIIAALSEPIGKDAKDAKIIAKLGGNINVGVGNGCLYYVDVQGGDKKEIEALDRSKIRALLTAVAGDYVAFKTYKDIVEKLNKQFEADSKELKKVTEPKEGDSKVAAFASRAITLSVAKLQKSSGINVINKISTLTYMTSVEAVKLAEWSMSGKDPKAIGKD